MIIEWIKRVYIYIFSAAGLILVIIGGVQLVNLGLKTWVFTKADVCYNYPTLKVPSDKSAELQNQEQDEKAIQEYQKNDLSSRRQRQAANALALMIIGLPLFLYHWRLSKKCL